MSIVAKVLTANRHAKSRLHDEKGNFVGWKKTILHGVPAVATGLLRIAFGYRPHQPWIAYEATSLFEKMLTPQSRVLEFGSGMSTLWYARRVKHVCAVENFRPWYDLVGNFITNAELASRVNYVFAASDSEYCSAMSEDEEGFDLIVVDGDMRDECIRHSTKLLKPDGAIYLDNSDRTAVPSQSEAREAERLLREFAAASGRVVHEITDFAPTQFI